MIDMMGLGCSLLRTPVLEQTMEALGYFGRGGIAGVVVLSLLGYGYQYGDPRSKKAAIALLAALIASAGATELARHSVQLPRPRLDSSFGFPSGHTSAAFSLAGVLGVAFPPFAAFFYLLALLTGISRLYFRAHYLVDVMGGAAIGVLFSIPVAVRLIPRCLRARRPRLSVLGWGVFSIVGVVACAFFYVSEQNISAHKLAPHETALTSGAVATVDFGSREARTALRHGWSADESWEDGKRSLVWATGLASEIRLDLPIVQGYVFRLNVLPYSPKGPACQRIEVRINNNPVTQLFLEQGWHWYGFEVPATAVRAGANDVHLLYAYAESPKARVGSADARRLSVAFDRLDVFRRTLRDPGKSEAVSIPIADFKSRLARRVADNG